MNILGPYDLSKLNTLGLKSTSEYYLELNDSSDLEFLIRDPEFKAKKWYILGGGSNLVLPENIFGLVIKMTNQGRQLVYEDKDSWFVKAQAGESWHEFVQWTLANSYYGLENLSLIPGTVGAAPIQNIGAYGVEVKDSIHQVTCINLTSGKTEVFTNEQCLFSYRDSFFKNQGLGKYIIWDVTFRLPKKNILHLEYGDISKELNRLGLPASAPNIARAVISIRTSKLPDPKIICNAGSFFKNPIVTEVQKNALLAKNPSAPFYPAKEGFFKIAAGWLIEQAGWKGKSLGPVGMYEKQALVLVNHGGAKSADVWNLAKQVCMDVKDKFDIQLEAEPVRW